MDLFVIDTDGDAGKPRESKVVYKVDAICSDSSATKGAKIKKKSKKNDKEWNYYGRWNKSHCCRYYFVKD